MVVSPNDLMSEEERKVLFVEKQIDDYLSKCTINNHGVVSMLMNGYSLNVNQVHTLEEMYKKSGWDEVIIDTHKGNYLWIVLKVYPKPKITFHELDVKKFYTNRGWF